VVVLDTRAESYTDDRFEDAVDIAASVVAASQGRGFPVRMISASGRVLVSRAGQSGHDIRDYLATVVADDAGSLQPATTRVLQAREHDAIVVIGGIVAPADLAEVTTMCRRFSTAVLVTVRDSGGPVWNAGAHLDGVDATTALLRWPKPASAVRRVEVAS
jgi:hypothetical protein